MGGVAGWRRSVDENAVEVLVTLLDVAVHHLTPDPGPVVATHGFDVVGSRDDAADVHVVLGGSPELHPLQVVGVEDLERLGSAQQGLDQVSVGRLEGHRPADGDDVGRE